MRTGTLSLDGVILTTEEFLFDLVSDVSESNNMISEDSSTTLVTSMREIYEAEGGDPMIIGWHTTDKSADWTNAVPEEWGFP